MLDCGYTLFGNVLSGFLLRKNKRIGEMRKQQAFNPYLPSYEYVPDGEPHVFGDRVYVYGSHDLFNGKTFCMGDYICWSAPVGDFSDWRYEGVIYKKVQDPDNAQGKKSMYAPDVCRGTDGKYYLYYFVDYHNKIGVAVCDTPAGKYEFLDFVRYEDGTPLGRNKGDVFQFDPGVYVEGGKVYLYSGFCPGFYPLVWGKHQSKHGPVCVVLKPDMVTIAEKPKYIGVKCAADAAGTPYEGHGFFEASSMRKIRDKYYFVYSSKLGHELCYATCDTPDGTFDFGGTIVSIGDVGLRGIKGVKDADNYCGNTHGSILDLGDRHYIFYHRQTNCHCFSRQACAEPITIKADGSIEQVEVTSCGLNGKPLDCKGEYEARIACVLKSPRGGMFYMPFKCKGRPYFTQSGVDREDNPDQYIADITDGSVIGFKYFDFKGAKTVSVKIKGGADGKLIVSGTDGGAAAGEIALSPCGEYTEFTAPLTISDGKSALFFTYKGSGKFDFMSFKLN